MFILTELKAARRDKYVRQKSKEDWKIISTSSQLNILSKCSFQSWWTKIPEIRRYFFERELHSASVNKNVMMDESITGIIINENDEHLLQKQL